MKINYNSTFQLLIDRYNLPADLNINIDLPNEIQYLISDNIVKNEFGISLANVWTPSSLDSPEKQSFHEDFENHFHIDSDSNSKSDQNAFELGIKTILELAKFFQNKKFVNVQLTYSFQTADMGKAQALENNLHEDNDKYFISDRLSFHVKRDGQIVLPDELFESRHEAILKIDI